ncbi:hypothetical protein BFW01_g1956 [Lasiodiplodia theobromae]|uniref:Uncharacterized protein n=1 Tax=Lasiodiplodia theobromae TaxID=45133 RepID=A0A5N5D7D7_9PEZI|nr:Cytochrome p450 [Lasiodiplodia theobromae]KAB2573262.1 hypothetical protein DBV05_g8096 [Lasiodiplodia theobromae]KAF4543353.1 Cytochrome p450 [Lasiodiplodia theobromae]KAF9631094.1 hypothetical protein BFW01_g1956 [Lasiodiplodia theobromae]
MQLTALFTFLLLGAASANPVLEARQKDGECTEKYNCCYSSRDACNRQLGGWANFLTAQMYCPLHKYCIDYGITRKQCNADCCDIKTGWGRGCPGK